VNRSFCNTCGELAPSEQLERDGKVFLVKDCRTCGKTETLIASDARRYYAKRDLDYGHQYHGCNLNCSTCGHSGLTPSFAFVDVTNRCNMDCPICCDNVPSMGYTFDPPMEYFESLFDQLAQMEPRPTVALFGGEPTAREDLFDIIDLSRKHGLKTRVVTNGLKMADPDYCDRLLATRATILLSYDGAHPETYMSLRGSAKSLPLKQKAIENIGKSPNLHAGRIYFITCVARGVNDHEIPELLDFYHSKRKFLSSVHFMPLAHTWKCGAMGFEPERITTEDIEDLVDQVYPDDTVDFIPAGFIAQFSLVSSLFGSTRFPFLGAHPNCESVYMLVSNGERYVPVSHYLRCTLTELGRDLMELEQRLRGGFLRKVRLGAALLRLFVRRVRLGRLLKGWGPLKVWNALALLARFAVGAKGRKSLAKHTHVQGALQLIVLPFEDNYVIETDRLERCPNLHVYLEPATDELKFVPVCAWRLFNKKVMAEIADHYEKQKAGQQQAAAQPSP